MKTPAIWTGVDSSSKVTPSGGGALLLETGGYLLFEGSINKLLLEGSVITSKEQTAWVNGTAKAATQWSGDGFTTFNNAGTIQRVQQDGTVRKQQDLTVRVQQGSAATAKANTAWSEI